jgi:hypothetical protein
VKLSIVQSIAGGMIGPESFQGGWTAAIPVLDFLIASAPRRPILCASHMGSWVLMYWMVIPLSRYHPFSLSAMVMAIITPMICAGLPICLTVRRYAKPSV